MAEDADPDARFAVPDRPERRLTDDGGVRYEGQVVFGLEPEPGLADADLDALVADVLSAEVYRYGDWFELPMPLYLVRDDDTGDTFRVAVRDGAVELHVLPDTGRAGLAAFADRLAATGDVDWTVERRTGE